MTDRPEDRPDSMDTDDAGEKPGIESLKRLFREDWEHSGEWRDQAREDYDFVAGNQWSSDDLAKLKEQLRPAITFNRVGTIIDAVVGTEINNRQETRFIPREQGDARVNEMMTAAADWVRDECDAEDEETDAFTDLVICGMGWTETRLSEDEESDGQNIVIDRVDPLEMAWDSSARKRNLSDARRVWRVREVPLSEAREMFPDADEDDLDAAWAVEAQEEGGKPHDAENAKFYSENQRKSGDQTDHEDRKVRLVEYQWWERETRYRVGNEELTEEQYRQISERAAELGMPLEGQPVRRKAYKRAFLGGDILEEGPLPCKEGFHYRCMTGKRDRNNNIWYGLVRGMKDPQRWANKWLSQILHIVNSQAKGGIMAERDAFDKPSEAEESWPRTDAITWLKPGALSKKGPKVQEKPQASLPAGLAQMLEFAVSSIRDVPGINLELLGMADRQQAGVLEYQRRQAGITILATLFDALRRYRKQQGRVLLYFIRTYISDGRLIRITGDQGNMKYVPLLRDPNVARYDVIVDDAPSAPNQKEKVWSILGGMMPMLTKLPVPGEVWIEVLRYSPLPESLVQKVIEALQKPQIPSPEAQAQMAKTAADTRKTTADAQKTEAETVSEVMGQHMAVAIAGMPAEPPQPQGFPV